MLEQIIKNVADLNRDVHLVGEFGVVASVDQATDSTALTVLPISTLDQFFGVYVRLHLRDHVGLEFRIIVVRDHVLLQIATATVLMSMRGRALNPSRWLNQNLVSGADIKCGNYARV